MIPDEAVEAAARAMRLHDKWPQEWPDLARAALEAAAPHLMATLSIEDLLSTKAGLALANAAHGEGLNAGIKACNDTEGGEPFRKP